MKKFRMFLMLAMAMMLLCSAALADTRTDCPGADSSGVDHWYDLWHTQNDGCHWSECLRELCDHEKHHVPCAAFTFAVNGATYTVCPICGEFDGGHFVFTTGRTLGSGMPNGERIIRSMADPCGDGSVLAAYTVAWEQLGKLEELNTTAQVSCKLIVDGDFRLVRADGDAYTDVDYTVTNGQLMFNTTESGVFLLLEK